MSDLMKIVLMLSLSGTALAAFLALLRRALKNRLPHGLFYYLWLLVLLRLMVPVALPVPGLELTLPEPGPIEQTVEIDPELITAIQQTQNQLPPGTADDQWEIVTVHGAVLDNGLPMPSAPTKTEPRTRFRSTRPQTTKSHSLETAVRLTQSSKKNKKDTDLGVLFKVV